MDRSTRGKHAKRLMEDEVLQEAFNGVLEYHRAKFDNPTVTDEEILEARRLAMMVETVKGQLRSMIADGRIAEKKG